MEIHIHLGSSKKAARVALYLRDLWRRGFSSLSDVTQEGKRLTVSPPSDGPHVDQVLAVLILVGGKTLPLKPPMISTGSAGRAASTRVYQELLHCCDPARVNALVDSAPDFKEWNQ